MSVSTCIQTHVCTHLPPDHALCLQTIICSPPPNLSSNQNFSFPFISVVTYWPLKLRPEFPSAWHREVLFWTHEAICPYHLLGESEKLLEKVSETKVPRGGDGSVKYWKIQFNIFFPALQYDERAHSFAGWKIWAQSLALPLIPMWFLWELFLWSQPPYL